MCKVLSFAVLSLCFCSGPVFADTVAVNAVVPNNQGYVYGTPPKADDSAAAAATTDTSTASTAESGGIISAIGKLDTWIRNNLW